MATSLVCKQCDTLFAGVDEARQHNEITGHSQLEEATRKVPRLQHSQFEESTRKVPRLQCTACGKVCRSEVEKAMHSRHTGHAEFVDRTDEADAIDTEAQIAAARADAAEEAAADAELLGIKRKLPPAGAAAAGAGAGAAGEGAGGGGGGGEGAEGGGGGEGEEMVPVEVDPSHLAELTAMGFPEARAARALHFAGAAAGVEGAVAWLADREGEEGLDEPLLVPKSSIKKPLSEAEKRQRAEEALRRAKERREADERAAERERERNRIRHGKELLEAQRKEEEQRVRRIAEDRERERREEAAAREKLRAKLEEDRRERRRRLGLPEELTEEEKAAEAEKARQKAAQEVARRTQYVKPVSMLERLRPVLVSMKKGAPGGEEQFKTAASTLLKYLANVARAPEEEKYRRIPLGGAAFQARVAAVPGAVEALEVVGFKREADGSALFMPREAADPSALEAAGGEINSALTNPFFGVL
ncbi:hypothetical protein Rsub_07347 [Raphidocelis subcapitata]|uniref:UBA domain-containing protein n=1 Tax=Raphidocelis subcapitata TaxID=307507 RepID=A0A2V0P3B9_9CHLO|nr:hypothetical protein Rsub_07347 [Raphidocelis subcapitata]|eukprot:GBF94079.1 hypothetical protein Rsub_07347 [Raphidocelis subcapitata]